MAADSHTRRERPWLLPYNRKIRHLQGITIRNLTLVHAPQRPRGKTIDDDAIPSALRTPTKAVAQRESRRLEHSRSSNDLRPIGEAVVADLSSKEDGGLQDSPPRPLLRTRRRSTMEWSGASPLERQKRLEEVAGGRMADVFFSLHVEAIDDPVYVSEEVEKAMNPNFRFFDLDSWGPSVTRLDAITVKVWVKSEAMKEHQHLLDLTVNFRALQFIGKALDSFHHPFPQNCVLFHFTDGIYTSFTDMSPEEHTIGLSHSSTKTTSGRTDPTSSYDQLMRLSTLDVCIQDALATRDRLASDINGVVETGQDALSMVNQVPEALERVKTIESTVHAQRKRLESAKKKRAELEVSIQSRRDAIKRGREMQEKALEDVLNGQEQLKQREFAIQQTQDEIVGQRRRVCEDLLKIYPIEPIPGRSLAFTIRGLPLPNSEFDNVKEDVTAAALGFVAQAVAQIAVYFSHPPPYPITPRGSTSTIEDPISMTTGPRVYPLYMRGSVRYRFEYGVFLLNKDIEILSNSIGLKLLDIRQTLPNLKYLLYVATAGKGDIPARKAGGFRALLRYPGLSRSLSNSSSINSTANSAVLAEGKGEGGAKADKGGVVIGNGVSTTPSFKMQRTSALRG
ncbi:uncharacterized protein K452DRAFT_273185 [Aplosporella prunicola CBS 121167]|uniref:Autophagy-related protein 14 n=1 Tax=Aplosporella prunicola CBS 121167 TaxID=1176127 RepID=A0A6A6BAE5_9PEZI|nr:uncharacterized protein K452DRAFT_273185 [Aplosporella prunicola CBS 121167]KAF2140558.1 hypothetical protein K452DRAFT_273185 [Aplosporella prunicola CBS 121167]